MVGTIEMGTEMGGKSGSLRTKSGRLCKANFVWERLRSSLLH